MKIIIKDTFGDEIVVFNGISSIALKIEDKEVRLDVESAKILIASIKECIKIAK